MTTYFTAPNGDGETTLFAGTGPDDDRTRQISRTDFKTVNPFNTHPNGQPKTAQELLSGLRAEWATWVPSGPELWHGKCWDNAEEADR